ncbi:unnamed protein product [Linum tenue]|uniref:Uncharacterized protein n=1 Tax=Linum tenue TaxID=586396 RepID=A0AAV0NXJ4_9ROSI|nr:unnamed protein product [Linum tenue]
MHYVPTGNQWRKLESYDPSGFPAPISTSSLVYNCKGEVRGVRGGTQFVLHGTPKQ